MINESIPNLVKLGATLLEFFQRTMAMAYNKPTKADSDLQYLVSAQLSSLHDNPFQKDKTP